MTDETKPPQVELDRPTALRLEMLLLRTYRTFRTLQHAHAIRCAREGKPFEPDASLTEHGQALIDLTQAVRDITGIRNVSDLDRVDALDGGRPSGYQMTTRSDWS